MSEVMIVDDEPTIQQLMAIILEDMGHMVISQPTNGDSAIRAYRSMAKKPDLLIIDHRIPILSGSDLASMVIEENPEQRILFLTADGSVRDEITALGIKDFLEKPADIETIKKAVETALSR